VSAQIIAALRRRADELDAEAAAGRESYDHPDFFHRTAPQLRLLAEEFRALAGEAESVP